MNEFVKKTIRPIRGGGGVKKTIGPIRGGGREKNDQAN